jgi:hypothetical protein
MSTRIIGRASRTIIGRKFDSALCCDHDWQLGACTKCGAQCERDERGRIVDYDAAVQWYRVYQ